MIGHVVNGALTWLALGVVLLGVLSVVCGIVAGDGKQ